MKESLIRGNAVQLTLFGNTKNSYYALIPDFYEWQHRIDILCTYASSSSTNNPRRLEIDTFPATAFRIYLALERGNCRRGYEAKRLLFGFLFASGAIADILLQPCQSLGSSSMMDTYRRGRNLGPLPFR
jgi:hypothetical protein